MDTHNSRRGVIKRDLVRVDGSEGNPKKRAEPSARVPAADTAHVRLVALDEHTQGFEFTCSCGEVSLIEIQYEKKS